MTTHQTLAWNFLKEQENDNCLKLNESCYEILKVLIEKSKLDGSEWFDSVKLETLLNKPIDKTAFSMILLALATENLIDLKKE